ncbi:hypothetical protein ACWD4V_00765 [Streptomyces tsukubensis]
MPKTSTIRAITQGERELRDWHRNLRRGAAAAGFGMMLASLYQLHWAGVLIGFPTLAAAAMAGSLEMLLAFNAAVVTSIRKRTSTGTEGGYYWSLWLIFAFLLLISIAANVGHAVIALNGWLSAGNAPILMVENQAYVYAVGSAVAAMVPLGGSFGLHVAGFVRAHGAGSDWVDQGSAPDSAGAQLSEPARIQTPPQSVMKVPPQPSQAVKPSVIREPSTQLLARPRAEDEVDGRFTARSEPVTVLSEEALYAIYREARDAGEEYRLGPRGDLNPTQLGRRLGQSPQNGRKNVGPRFDTRYRTEMRTRDGAEEADGGIVRAS